MIEFTTKIVEYDGEPPATVTLTFDLRQKSRQRVTLDNGQEAAIILPRGSVLFDQDLLQSVNGGVVRVKAAAERLSMVECREHLPFARACYHLGNRHVALQIEEGKLCYLHDHVIDDMLIGLGFTVQSITAPFEPESGAYGGKGAAHAHH